MTSLPPPARAVRRVVHGGRGGAGLERNIPEEVAIALTYNRHAYATMMASPQDLEDFAVGFSLAEGIITEPREIVDLKVVALAQGIELRMTIAPDRFRDFSARRRHMAGPTGCGLCGIEAVEEAMRQPPRVVGTLSVRPDQITRMIADMAARQTLNHLTRAVHAAGFWQAETGLRVVREDVGRHNALDKLAGAVAREGLRDPGVVVLTSRVSVEMVQKTAVLGAPILVAVSAPTALAVSVAEAADITLVAIARDDGFEIFTHPGRIADKVAVNVA
jgi:FdhD protein